MSGRWSKRSSTRMTYKARDHRGRKKNSAVDTDDDEGGESAYISTARLKLTARLFARWY